MNSLESILSHDLDQRRRTLYIHGDIDEAKALDVTKKLHLLDSTSQAPIFIHLSTYGGDVYEGLCIYDQIRLLRSPVTIIASGKVMSAGSFIYLAGDLRLATPNVSFMFHSVHDELAGHVHDIKIDLKEAEDLQKRMIKIYKTRTKKIKEEFWKDFLRTEQYLDVKAAVKMGIVQEILSEDE